MGELSWFGMQQCEDDVMGWMRLRGGCTLVMVPKGF
jgi:hypothetical protein